jgi:hypothetical protein
LLVGLRDSRYAQAVELRRGSVESCFLSLA